MLALWLLWAVVELYLQSVLDFRKLTVLRPGFNPNYFKILACLILPSSNKRTASNVAILKTTKPNNDNKDAVTQFRWAQHFHCTVCTCNSVKIIFMPIRAYPLLACTQFSSKDADKADSIDTEELAGPVFGASVRSRHPFTFAREMY